MFLYLYFQARGGERDKEWEQQKSFDISKSFPSDIAHPTRLHLLNLPKKSTTEDQYLWDYGIYYYSNHHSDYNSLAKFKLPMVVSSHIMEIGIS